MHRSEFEDVLLSSLKLTRNKDAVISLTVAKTLLETDRTETLALIDVVQNKSLKRRLVKRLNELDRHFKTKDELRNYYRQTLAQAYGFHRPTQTVHQQSAVGKWFNKLTEPPISEDDSLSKTIAIIVLHLIKFFAGLYIVFNVFGFFLVWLLNGSPEHFYLFTQIENLLNEFSNWSQDKTEETLSVPEDQKCNYRYIPIVRHFC